MLQGIGIHRQSVHSSIPVIRKLFGDDLVEALLAFLLGCVAACTSHFSQPSRQLVVFRPSTSFPPLQNTQGAKSVPPAGGTLAFYFEIDFTLEGVLKTPSSVLLPLFTNDVNRLGDARISLGVDVLEEVEPSEDIVVPPWRKRKFQKDGLDNGPGAVRSKQPVHQ